MNILGAIAYISVLAIFGYAIWQAYLRDHAAYNRQELTSLEEKIKDQRAQVAALASFIASMERDIPVLKDAIVRLDQEYIRAIHRNSAISDVYSVASSAWGNEA